VVGEKTSKIVAGYVADKFCVSHQRKAEIVTVAGVCGATGSGTSAGAAIGTFVCPFIGTAAGAGLGAGLGAGVSALAKVSEYSADIRRCKTKAAQTVEVDIRVGDGTTFDNGHPLYEAGISYMDIQPASGSWKRSHVINVHSFGKMYVEFFSERTEPRFLPMTQQGKPVLVPDGGNKWRADNSTLQADAKGVFYHSTKQLHDKTDDLVRWGSVVEGLDTGDGWLNVQCDPEGMKPEMKSEGLKHWHLPGRHWMWCNTEHITMVKVTPL
jgi:hypothetical protein